MKPYMQDKERGGVEEQRSESGPKTNTTSCLLIVYGVYVYGNKLHAFTQDGWTYSKAGGIVVIQVDNGRRDGETGKLPKRLVPVPTQRPGIGTAIRPTQFADIWRNAEYLYVATEVSICK